MQTELRLTLLLDQAIKLDRAVKGNIQIYEPDTDSLKIVVQRGFDQAFLRHFELSDSTRRRVGGHSVSGTSLWLPTS